MMMRSRKILVTGAGGFIGSHLVESLVERGYSVRAFVRYNSRADKGWLEKSEYKDDLEIVAGDIRDYDQTSNCVKGCDTIFHLAALIGIPYSYFTPLAYIRTNILGTYNILEAAKSYKVANIVITSTSETYGTARYVPIEESHPKIGQSPYAATKLAADQLALSYHMAFGLPVKVARPFNTYGPRQSARAIIPTIIIQLLAGSKQIRLGSLFPTRDLVFVKDTVGGLIKIAASDKAIGEEINIATQTEISIGDLASKIITMVGSDATIVNDERRIRPEKGEVRQLLGSNEKLKKITGWNPAYELTNGLRQTIDWFKKEENLRLYDAGAYNI
jgi:dTDP-glucose 4,6-dehydratase